jgi:glycosyltransferase involved in cell wall biosynthesis
MYRLRPQASLAKSETDATQRDRLAPDDDRRRHSQGRLEGLRLGVAAVSLSRGGAERAAAQWAAASAEQGAAVRFFAVEAADEQYPLPPSVAVTVAAKGSRRDTARVILSLRRFAADCDLVAAFQPYVAALCLIAGIRVPTLLVSGQDPRQRRDTTRMPAFLWRLAFRSAVAAAAPSRGLIECHERLGLRPRTKWHLVPNMVGDEAFIADESRGEGVLHVGRLVAEKRPLLALHAVARAGSTITFLGDGPLRRTLQEEAERLGMRERVRFHAFTRTPWRLYAQHRMLVLTSRYETFANVVVESLAAGTPVVSVDCDFGPREILAGARHSVLAAATSEALAEGIGRIASRPRSTCETRECRAIAARYRREAVGPRIAEVLSETAPP